MRYITKKLQGEWRKYWFEREPVIGLALFRILFGISLVLFYLPRFLSFRDLEFYKDTGFLWPNSFTSWVTPLSQSTFFSDLSLPSLSFQGAYAATIALGVLAGLLALGWKTRLVAFTAFLLNTFLVSITNLISVDTIAAAVSIFLLMLSFASSGDFLSLDAKLKYGTWTPSPIPIAPKTIRQLMVVQLGIMYMSNAMAKIVYIFPAWISGDEIVNTILNPDWGYAWLKPLVDNFEGPLRIFVAFGFLGFLLLGVGLLLQRTRPFAAVFGFLWHVTSFVLTTLGAIWVVWLSFYIFAVNPEIFERAWKHRNEKIAFWRLVLFGVAVSFMILIVMF